MTYCGMMGIAEIVASLIHSHYKAQTQELQQVLIEQEELKGQWHNYQQLITHENSIYACFEQSMILKISTPHIITTLIKYLFEVSQVRLVDINLSLERQQPEYIMYRINLEVGGWCESEILDLIDRLNFPNIMAIDYIHIRRCAQVSSTNLQQMTYQSLDDVPLLICGKISAFWLSWQGD